MLVWIMFLSMCIMAFKLDKCMISAKSPFDACFKDFVHGFHTQYIISANPYFLHSMSLVLAVETYYFF